MCHSQPEKGLNQLFREFLWDLCWSTLFIRHLSAFRNVIYHKVKYTLSDMLTAQSCTCPNFHAPTWPTKFVRTWTLASRTTLTFDDDQIKSLSAHLWFDPDMFNQKSQMTWGNINRNGQKRFTWLEAIYCIYTSLLNMQHFQTSTFLLHHSTQILTPYWDLLQTVPPFIKLQMCPDLFYQLYFNVFYD